MARSTHRPAGRRVSTRRGRAAVGVTAAVLLALAAPAWAGHESPFYPSYYPQEIRLDTVAPAAAARLLENASIHAYIGADPYASRTAPRAVAPVESLGSYVVVTLNQASGRGSSPAARCAVAGDVIRSLGRAPGVFVFHPYPVTAYHRDYLEHAGLAAAALQGYASRGGEAPGRSVAVAAAGT